MDDNDMYLQEKNRKHIRLKSFDYNKSGTYFLTICVKDRECILSEIADCKSIDKDKTDVEKSIVGTGVLDGPIIKLLECGKIADKYINQLDDFYHHISVDGYVIMPNHIHIMLSVLNNGPSGTPVPTLQNSVVSRFVSTFKRFCNKEIGENIWQLRSNDHIIRDAEDYDKHMRYIAENPIRWHYDELYYDGNN